MKHWNVLLAAGMLLAATGTAVAQGALEIQSQRPFDTQRQAIVDDLGGDKYSEISAQDKATVIQALERIASRIGDGSKDLAQLGEDDKVAVYNDQALVNNLLTQAGEDSRMVCRREKTIGSQRVQNQCMTVAERRRHRDAAQSTIVDGRRTGKVTN